MRARNCKLVDIRLWTGYTCNDDGEGAGSLTEIENFDFKNIELLGISRRPEEEVIKVTPIMLWGFDEPEYYIKNVIIDTVKIPQNENELQKIELKNIENVSISNISYYKL